MSSAPKDLDIDQGADWFVTFIYKDSSGTPINITGYSAAMQLRANYSDVSPAMSLSTGSGITITGSTGSVAVHATAAQTGALTAGEYFYDVEITSGTGIVTRLISGVIRVSPQVTR